MISPIAALRAPRAANSSSSVMMMGVSLVCKAASSAWECLLTADHMRYFCSAVSTICNEPDLLICMRACDTMYEQALPVRQEVRTSAVSPAVQSHYNCPSQRWCCAAVVC